MACVTLDSLPDALLLLILDCVADAKTITRCAAVSFRLRSLLCHINNVVLKPDNMSYSHTDVFSRLCGRILKKPNPVVVDNNTADRGSNATQLKSFSGIKFLRIELPSPELGLEKGSLLKWSASFGSTLNSCVVLGANSVVCASGTMDNIMEGNSPPSVDKSIIPESFYTSGDLKSRVVWTISSLIAASARHYTAHQLIKQHKILESLIVNDTCGQGVLRMDKKQLEELRAMQTSASPSGERNKREVFPEMEMRLWYAEQVELCDGSVLTGVTLGAIRPRRRLASGKGFSDGDWVASAFEEPFASVAKVLVKGRAYCVDMGSF